MSNRLNGVETETSVRRKVI